MNHARRMALWLGLLGLLLAILCTWAYGQMASARDAKLSAEADLAQCRQLAQDLKQIQSRPALASGAERQSQEVNHQIETAAQQAGLDVKHDILSIAPQAPRAIEQSVYKQMSTLVMLKGITLRQLASLVYGLTGEGSALGVHSLRLSAPRGSETGDDWAVELTVSYLLYDPTQKDNPSRE